ncbi:MAG: conjugal transfer protein TraF, partial [Conexivisphaerales archaeon]
MKTLFIAFVLLLLGINAYANIKKGEVINYKGDKWIVSQVNNSTDTALLCPYYDYQNYFNSSNWGWFYNAKCLSIPLKEFEQKKKEVQTVQNSTVPQKKLSDQEIIKLATNPYYLNHLSASEFKKMYDHVTDIAVMQPTKKNIAAYMYMTNFIRVKSLIFSHAVVAYTMENPKYNMIKKIGETSWSYNNYNQDQSAKQKKLLADHEKNLGLIVFIKNGCPYCEKQLPVLSWFQSDYHIDVIAVSSNTCPQNTSGIQCMVNPGAFKAYNIQYEPTMVLVIKQPDGSPKFEPVGVGLTDEVTLANR